MSIQHQEFVLKMLATSEDDKMKDWLIQSEAAKFRFKPREKRKRGPTPLELDRLEAIELGQGLGGWISPEEEEKYNSFGVGWVFHREGKGTTYGVNIASRPRWRRALPSLERYEEWVIPKFVNWSPRRRNQDHYVPPYVGCIIPTQ